MQTCPVANTKCCGTGMDEAAHAHKTIIAHSTLEWFCAIVSFSFGEAIMRTVVVVFRSDHLSDLPKWFKRTGFEIVQIVHWTETSTLEDAPSADAFFLIIIRESDTSLETIIRLHSCIKKDYQEITVRSDKLGDFLSEFHTARHKAQEENRDALFVSFTSALYPPDRMN